VIGVIGVIQKQQTGKGFGGILRYCLDQSRELGHDGAHIIATAAPISWRSVCWRSGSEETAHGSARAASSSQARRWHRSTTVQDGNQEANGSRSRRPRSAAPSRSVIDRVSRMMRSLLRRGRIGHLF